ncbi:hypothetical protein BDV41DRAFT_466566 [Aspergillus transmontanensis]|uniref:Uncharacterized protein n=1 Tax=Aspergillus transmontanensis TaxID=1034304 RepID=A0A5N6VKV0_9EURO|nr:hypothetical protein BDV41DRAFT_466566 [Aspergillus transmontanensis]
MICWQDMVGRLRRKTKKKKFRRVVSTMGEEKNCKKTREVRETKAKTLEPIVTAYNILRHMHARFIILISSTVESLFCPDTRWILFLLFSFAIFINMNFSLS